MPFREKQKLNLYSFSPIMEEVEQKKNNKITYKLEDATLRKLPSPENFKLSNIVETGNVSKLDKVNTIINSRVSEHDKEPIDIDENTTTPNNNTTTSNNKEN